MLQTCPHCHGSLQITVKGLGATEKSSPGSPITSRALRAVQAFMRERGPGDYLFRDLADLYDDLRTGEDPNRTEPWPALNDNAFARALVRNGARRYRTAKERYYTIPEIAADQKPGPVATSVQDRLDQEAYQEMLVKHGGGTSTAGPVDPLDALPFEVEKPAEWVRPPLPTRERREAARAQQRRNHV
jgi:hypothetical protein